MVKLTLQIYTFPPTKMGNFVQDAGNMARDAAISTDDQAIKFFSISIFITLIRASAAIMATVRGAISA